MLNLTVDSALFWPKIRDCIVRTGVDRYSVHLLKELLKVSEMQISFLQSLDNAPYTTDLFHSFFQWCVVPSSYKKKKITSIITLHDMIGWRDPDPSSDDAFAILQRYKCLPNADYYICPSKHSSLDLMNDFSIDPSRVFVTPLAACPKLFKPTASDFIYEKYKIPRNPYFLSVSTLDDRKNVHLLVKAFRQVIESERIKDFNFVIAGPLKSQSYEMPRIYAEYREDRKIFKRFIFLNYVENKDLAALYSNARATGFISAYEGFGLPALEAMQCGSPLISSNLTSLPEVCGGAAILVNPYNKDDLCQAILNIYNSTSLCAKQSSLGLQRAKEFSWEKTAERTLEVYKIALENQ